MLLDPQTHNKVKNLMHKVSNEVLLPYYRSLKKTDIKEKSPGDLVTIADKLSEEALSDGLHHILTDAKIVGEEASAEDPALLRHLSSEQCWLIDPIDGTGNYANGKGSFGIIIAYLQNNRTIAGWMYDPIKKRLCHAIKGQGAFINGKRVKTPTHIGGLPIAALATEYMDIPQRQRILSQAMGQYQCVPIPMCAAEQYPLLALGDHHISIFERTLAWDHAAGILFLNEAGGKAARWNGDEYRPADKGKGLLGASNPQLWEQAVQIFAQ